MSNSQYIDLFTPTPLQIKIMTFVDEWAREEKTPIPQAKIIKALEEMGTTKHSTVYALNSLLRMGYIRRAVGTSNKTYYVQLKRV